MTNNMKINEVLKAPKSRGFWQNAFRRFRRNHLAMMSMVLIIVLALLCAVVPMLSHYDYSVPDFANSLQSPSFTHLFGSDGLGRDLFVRSFIGGRITFEIAFAATIVVLLLGVLYGSVAGFLGGKVDAIMMRFVDVLYGVPFLFFSILPL